MKQAMRQTRSDSLVYDQSYDYPNSEGTPALLTDEDLEQIVSLSGLDSKTGLGEIARPFQFVAYNGGTYKVRACQSREVAEQWLQLLGGVNHMFAHCYGNVGRYLVFEYVNANENANAKVGAHSHSRTSILFEIADFLAELAHADAPYSLEDDFNSLCKDIEAAGIFKPQTMKLIRRYFAGAQSLDIKWGLEYFDPLPRNFLHTGDGSLISIDEKHLRVGPRSVGLIKMMEQLPEDDFAQIKEAYFAQVGFIPFEFPKYNQFLQFYRCLCALGTIGAHRSHEINKQEPRYHVNRQIVLRIVKAPLTTRLREEPPWVAYPRYPAWRFTLRAWHFVKRRILHIEAIPA